MNAENRTRLREVQTTKEPIISLHCFFKPTIRSGFIGIKKHRHMHTHKHEKEKKLGLICRSVVSLF